MFNTSEKYYIGTILSLCPVAMKWSRDSDTEICMLIEFLCTNYTPFNETVLLASQHNSACMHACMHAINTWIPL